MTNNPDPDITEPMATIRVPVDVLPPEHGRLGSWLVAGDCMSGDRIYDGDIVVVDFDRQPVDGDIVVAHIRNWRHSKTGQLVHGRVLKRLRVADDGAITLEPSNPEYLPMRIEPEHELEIESVVVGRIRSYETEDTGAG